jgi:hypothetical protein
MDQEINRLKAELEDVARDREFHGRYAHELELHRHEDDIFRRMAFENVEAGGAISAQPYVTSVYSELYEPLQPDERQGVRDWWHERTKTQAMTFPDLNERLTKLRRAAGAS